MLKHPWMGRVFLSLLPGIYLIVYIVIGDRKGPYFWRPHQDPDYAYLLDSLNILNSITPGVFQHPGTTVQILGAIAVGIGHGVRSGLQLSADPLVEDVLKNPELYLSLINYLFLALSAFSFWLLGQVSFTVNRNLLLSLVLQTTPFIAAFIIMVNEPSRVAPEGILLSTSQWVAIALLLYLYRESVVQRLWFSLFLGITIGAGLVTKITFVPMLLFFLILPGIRQKLIASVATVITFVVLTIPIMSHYIKIGGWLTDLTIHTGRYGGGEKGIVDTPNLDRIVANVVFDNSLFFILVSLVTGLCLLIFVLIRIGQLNVHAEIADRLKFKKTYFLVLLTTIVMWLQILITIKEHGISRYLTPSIALIGMAIFLFIQLTIAIAILTQGATIPVSALTDSVEVIALILCIAVGIQQTNLAFQEIERRHQINAADLAMIQQQVYENPVYENCILVTARRASTPESALKYASFWTGNTFKDQLQALYPHARFFIIDKSVYQSYTQTLDPTTILSPGQTCILYQTGTLKRQLVRKNNLKPIFIGKVESVYRIPHP